MRHPQTETHTGGGVFWGAHTPDKNLLVSRAPPPWKQIYIYVWKNDHLISGIFTSNTCAKSENTFFQNIFIFALFWVFSDFAYLLEVKATDETVPTIYRICLGHFYIPKFVSRGWGFRIKIICPCWYIKLKRRANVYLEKKIDFTLCDYRVESYKWPLVCVFNIEPLLFFVRNY